MSVRPSGNPVVRLSVVAISRGYDTFSVKACDGAEENSKILFFSQGILHFLWAPPWRSIMGGGGSKMKI